MTKKERKKSGAERSERGEEVRRKGGVINGEEEEVGKVKR